MINRNQYPNFTLRMASLLSLLLLMSPLSLFSQDSSPVSSDFNGDGVVDLSDYDLFRIQWNTRAGGPNWDAKFDLDGDGVINSADYAIFRDNWGQTVRGTTGQSPDLVIASMSATYSPTVDLGGSFDFTLSVTVDNEGNGSSVATTLRYYRSTDGSYSTDDTQVGTDDVDGLAASGTSKEEIDLTSHRVRGRYYIACIDAVSGDPIPIITATRFKLECRR